VLIHGTANEDDLLSVQTTMSLHFQGYGYLIVLEQEAQLSLTNRAMLVCKVVEVWHDFLSEYVDEVHVHMLIQTVNWT